MKKLAIAFAAVAVGVCANAASIQWTMAKVTPYSGASSYSAFLVEKGGFATAEAAALAIIDAGTSVDGFLYNVNGQTYTASSVTYVKSAANNTAWDAPASITANASIDYYSIMIANGSDGALAWLSATDNNAGNAKVSAAGKLMVAYSNLSSATWHAVPEPTSGLLLLVGGALLGLRRRRA